MSGRESPTRRSLAVSLNSIRNPTHLGSGGFNKDNIHLLYQHVRKAVDLVDFVEREAGVTLNVGRGGKTCSCHCPLPDHKDDNASFHLTRMEDDVWVYHCFGCGAKGNIINFCKDFFRCANTDEAILFLCDRLNIKNTEELMIEGLKKVSKRVDSQRTMENSNILVSNQCRMLLHRDYNKHVQWVSKAYKRLNKALDEQNHEEVEQIGYEAFSRMQE